MFLKTACILFLLRFALCVDDDGDYSNGFGEDYNWQKDLDTALAVAKDCGKPVMVIIHKSWCPRCVDLSYKFSESESIKELSNHFVLVNCIDDDEPTGPVYSPDGRYIPRVIFLSKDGEPLNCINKWGNPEYKYYFYKTEHIENCMKEILDEQ